jgi:hypothetical protein
VDLSAWMYGWSEKLSWMCRSIDWILVKISDDISDVDDNILPGVLHINDGTLDDKYS